MRTICYEPCTFHAIFQYYNLSENFETYNFFVLICLGNFHETVYIARIQHKVCGKPFNNTSFYSLILAGSTAFLYDLTLGNEGL